MIQRGPRILCPTSLQGYILRNNFVCVCEGGGGVGACVCSSVSFITSRVACCFRFDQ